MSTDAGQIPAPSPTDTLLAHCGDSLRAYADTLLIADGGLWTVYDRSRRAQAVLNNLCRQSDTAAGIEPENLRRAQLDDLEIALLSAAMRREIDAIRGDDVDRWPVIPFNDGTHLHLDGGERRTCKCDVRPGLLLNHGWDIPPPDWDLLELAPMVFGQFPQAFFEAIARHLWGTSKDVDFLACPTADAGKSTMASALARALPGAVVVRQAHSTLTAQRRKFSAHLIPLVDAKICAFDEVGKVDPEQWTQILFEVSPADLTVELKGVDAVDRPRFGNAVFIGECPPAFDASVQGVDARIGYTADLLLPPIDGETRRLWLSDTEIARLRAWILAFALDATQDARDRGYHRTIDRADIVRGMLPDGVQAMRDRFVGNGGKWISNKSLTDAMNAEGLDIPSGKAFAAFVRRCWPHAESSKQADGRGWRGVGA